MARHISLLESAPRVPPGTVPPCGEEGVTAGDAVPCAASGSICSSVARAMTRLNTAMARQLRPDRIACLFMDMILQTPLKRKGIAAAGSLHPVLQLCPG